jgi:hypothetical protein
MLATGRPSPAKLRNAMLYPGAFATLQKIGLIPKEANIIIGGADPLKIELDAVPPMQLLMQEKNMLLENSDNLTTIGSNPKLKK